MSIACFQKTMENLRRHSNFNVVSTKSDADAFVRRATFSVFKTVSEFRLTVSVNASSVEWNKPKHFGACV